MVEPEIVPQIEFASLEDFVNGSNNFHRYFIGNTTPGPIEHNPYRNKNVFKRFKEEAPELEKCLTVKITNIWVRKSQEDWPSEQLFEAYKIMSQLVYKGDPGFNSLRPEFYLCQ